MTLVRVKVNHTNSSLKVSDNNCTLVKKKSMYALYTVHYILIDYLP